MSSSNKRVGGLNIMEVPRYDNGYGYAPVKAHSVPTRKADVHLVARSQSHKVSASSRQPVAPAPYVAPLNIVKRKGVAQAPGAELYMNRPLPPLPGSAAAASRPQGITKPSTINTNKPLPPMPRPSVAPATNGIYTSTGQRITAPIETSAWSNTTESTRAIRRRQKRDKNLQSHSTTIMNAIPEARKATFKAPELLKTHATVGKPGQDRGKVQDSRWAATQAACRYTHRQEAQMAQDRMAAARRVIIPSLQIDYPQCASHAFSYAPYTECDH